MSNLSLSCCREAFLVNSMPAYMAGYFSVLQFSSLLEKVSQLLEHFEILWTVRQI